MTEENLTRDLVKDTLKCLADLGLMVALKAGPDEWACGKTAKVDVTILVPVVVAEGMAKYAERFAEVLTPTSTGVVFGSLFTSFLKFGVQHVSGPLAIQLCNEYQSEHPATIERRCLESISDNLLRLAQLGGPSPMEVQ